MKTDLPRPDAGVSLASSALAVDDAPAAEHGRPGAGKFLAALLERRMRWVPWLALALGLASAIGAGFWMEREVDKNARADFAVRAKDLADELESRIRAYGDVTYSIRALMDQQGVQRVDRAQFQRFVAAMAIPERYPGLKNISFAYHVPHAARAAFEQRMRLEWRDASPRMAPFELKPPGERAAYDIVSYIEPVQGNAAVIGLDLSGDAVRSEVIRNARDTGTLATSAGMKLLRDGEESTTGVLLRLAIYDGGGVPHTVESRRQAFIGVAGVSIRLAEMLDAALPVDERQELRVALYDVTGTEATPGGAKSEPPLLFESLDAGRAGAFERSALQAYTAVETIKVGNRTWELRVEPLAGFIEQRPERALPYATGAAIFMMALLLFGLLRSLATAKAQGIALSRNVKTLEFHRRRLAETQEIANIGGWEWDFRQHRQSWSDRLYVLFGRPIGDPPEPTDEFFISKVVHPADAPSIRKALKRVVEGEPPVGIECRIIRPNGEERIMSAVTRLETADDGERTRLVGTVRDITEDHRAAARERAQLLFIQTMMDAVPTPVFQKDPAGRFRACNDAWCQFVGKARDTIIGRTLEETLPGPHVELIRDQDEALLVRPAANAVEVKMPNARGELRELIVHKASYLADDGTIAGLVGVIFDITDRKHAEHRLEETIAILDRRNFIAKLQNEFGEILQSCVSLDEAYEAVAKYMPRLLPGTSGVLYRIDAAQARGDKAVGWGLGDAADSKFAPQECLAVRRGQPRCVADSAAELNCHHVTTPPPGSYACLPLSAQGELIGLLHVRQTGAEDTKLFDTEARWGAFMSAGEHIGLALANLTLRETLRKQATQDNLTGLYNRHYLDARFEQEFDRTQRKGAPLAVVMLDIDHFKRFNDTFGHAAGDHVLTELGKVIRSAGRKSDVACRYGGEEFLLFMPETAAQVALKRAEEIREAVKKLHLTWEGQALGAVTLSAGVAAYPEHGSDAGTMLRCADQALYRAKELGRDRVVLAPLHSPVSLHSAGR